MTGGNGVAAVVSTLAGMLGDARRAFAEEAAHGRGGRLAHAQFSGRVDAIVARVADEAPGAGCSPVAVAAIGGYGRRTLCLHSDLDLLVVFRDRLEAAEERFAKALLHPLWDLRVAVGHHVLRRGDVPALARTDREFLLAITDARHLAGDADVLAAAVEAVNGEGSAHHADRIAALLHLTAERHAGYNDTIYQLEPNVKDAPGALRDVTVARTLLALAEGRAGAPAAAWRKLEDAEEFLLRVRAALHLDAGRNTNVLGHEAQEKVADRLGFRGATPQHRVEALMSAYFAHARAVSRALSRARRLATTRGAGRGPASSGDGIAAGAPLQPAIPVGRNLQLTAEGLAAVDEVLFARTPASWLRAFDVARQRNAPLSDRLVAIVEERGAHCTVRDLLPTREDRRRLLRFLRPHRGLYAVLGALHDCGLLGRLFPEFQVVWCRVTRDFYHKYTVDEHTLLAIRGLERLVGIGRGPRARFGALLAELHAPELLVLALLFHDLGKWRDGNHAEESVRLAQTMMTRLELEPEARQHVEFLIGHHLQMSRVAFRRDTEDPAVVRRFAALVGTEERLKALCLLTLVDVEAVSAEALTPWREELLWRLYIDAYNQLTLGYSDDTIDGREADVAALQATRPGDVGEAELAAFLEGFPQRYLARFEPADIYRHARLARDLAPDGAHVVLESRGDAWELTVVAWDRPALFASICGVLSYFGMDILRGSAMTSPAGRVLDVFEFADRESFFQLNPDARATFEARLQAAVAGHDDVAALVRRRTQGVLHRRAPRRLDPVVHFDDEHSHRYTILEIVAVDAPGLLHGVSRVISEHGCSIDLVLISTEGHKAIDVFHLTRGGAKLPASVQAALARDLEGVLLQEDHEAHQGHHPPEQGGRRQGSAR